MFYHVKISGRTLDTKTTSIPQHNTTQHNTTKPAFLENGSGAVYQRKQNDYHAALLASKRGFCMYDYRREKGHWAGHYQRWEEHGL